MGRKVFHLNCASVSLKHVSGPPGTGGVGVGGGSRCQYDLLEGLRRFAVTLSVLSEKAEELRCQKS